MSQRTLTVTADVQIPRVPNFLRIGDGGDGPMLPIDALSDEDLRFVGAEWTANLLKRADELRLANNKPFTEVGDDG